jgi:hypothetical protein
MAWRGQPVLIEELLGGVLEHQPFHPRVPQATVSSR